MWFELLIELKDQKSKERYAEAQVYLQIMKKMKAKKERRMRFKLLGGCKKKG